MTNKSVVLVLRKYIVRMLGVGVYKLEHIL